MLQAQAPRKSLRVYSWTRLALLFCEYYGQLPWAGCSVVRACRTSLSYEAKKLVFVQEFYRRFCFVVRGCRTRLSYEEYRFLRYFSYDSLVRQLHTTEQKRRQNFLTETSFLASYDRLLRQALTTGSYSQNRSARHAQEYTRRDLRGA